MADLQDLLDALNRLGDNLGGGSTPATNPIEKSIDKLAETINARLGSTQNAAAAMKSANQSNGDSQSSGGQATATQQRQTRVNRGGVDEAIAHAASRSGLPILRDIGQQYNMAKSAITAWHKFVNPGDIGESFGKNAATAFKSSGAVNAATAFKSSGAVNAASKAVMPIAEEALAEGGGAESAAMASEALAGGLMTAAGAVIVVVGAFVAVGAAVVAFGKNISDYNRTISGFNAQMSMAFAIGDLRKTFRDMASANRRAESEDRFQKSWGDFMDKAQPIIDKTANLFEDAASAVLDFGTDALNGGLPYAGVNLGDRFINKITGKGFFEDDANNDSGNGETAVDGMRFQGISDIKKSIQGAIEAMKDLNKTLNESHQGSMGMTAAGFMAAAATTNRFGMQNRHFHVQEQVARGYGFRDHK